MTKSELIQQINEVFKDVRLENGVGLWQAQGIDDYADDNTMKKLREKDEKNNWQNLPYKDLAYCNSSLSFFDAKGMRFHLPKFLLFDLEQEEQYQQNKIEAPDLFFTLTHDLASDYAMEQFSLLNENQIKVIIDFLVYKQKEGQDFSSISNEFVEIDNAIEIWKNKLR